MKSGIKTFPLAVEDSDELKLIEVEFGVAGFAVIAKLYQCIHSKGYYTAWSQDEIFLFINDYRLSLVGRNTVTEIVDCAIRRGVFDTSLYKKYNILTNNRIQETFLKANSRTNEVKFDKNYALPVVYKFIEKASEKGKSVNIIFKNDDISDIKEKKEKEKKEKERDAPAQEKSHTQFEIPSFNEVSAYCKERNNTINPQRFIDYHSAIGWLKKGNPIIDWKAELRAWEKFDKPQGGINTGSKHFNTVTQKSVDELNALSGRISPEEL